MSATSIPSRTRSEFRSPRRVSPAVNATSRIRTATASGSLRLAHEARSLADVQPPPSHEAAVVRPPRELVARRELQLAQDARDVRLDGLHRQVQARCDLLVAVAARDQLQHLALACRERLELGVVADACALAERIEHETGEAWREDGVSRGNAQ